MDDPLICLISATPKAIGPTELAFATEFPEARLWNVLDDRLMSDALDAGKVEGALEQRMLRLIEHAVAGGADAVLLTCSMYAPVVERMDGKAVPVLAPDEQAFKAACENRFKRIHVVASQPEPLQDSLQRFGSYAAGHRDDLEIQGILCPPGSSAQELAAQCQGANGPADAILLAQYSLSPLASDISAILGVPVVAGPAKAAKHLQEMLRQNAPQQEGSRR